MNRIIILIALILILTTASAEIKDLTAYNDPLDLTTDSGEKASTSELRILQAIAKLEGRMASLESTKDACIKPAEYSDALVREQGEWDKKFNNAGIQFLITLLIWQVFFWASLFFMKGKGWF